MGRVWIHAVTMAQAIAAIAALIGRGRGGAVFTPNVDHVVLADEHAAFGAAYGRADLVLGDGAFVVWVSRLLGLPLPEKVSGSDLVAPLAACAAERGWRVFLLGAAPGVAAEAGRRLHAATGVHIVGACSPSIGADGSGDAELVAEVRAARPDLVLVALGTPKQEVWIDAVRAALAPAVLVGVGATFDFIAGRQRRAPAFVSAMGLEWLFRLAHEPRRLWRRYLVRDPAFVGIAWRTWRAPRATRVRGG